MSDVVDLRLTVVDWKFTDLDANVDGLVDVKELERVGRLVRKLVKPTSCAASFYRRCDVDFDSSLTRHEWNSCFDDNDDDADDNDSDDDVGVVDASRSTADGSCPAWKNKASDTL